MSDDPSEDDDYTAPIEIEAEILKTRDRLPTYDERFVLFAARFPERVS